MNDGVDEGGRWWSIRMEDFDKEEGEGGGVGRIEAWGKDGERCGGGGTLGENKFEREVQV